ncbi:MAG: hypothetical protein HQL09_04195 [Nitrospirae bacterium]|nr:hypothetical protein [Nitrospirota bacterium]
MATMIIRGLDDDILKAIRTRAKLEGISENTTLIKLIKNGLRLTGLENEGVVVCKNELGFLWTKPY